MFLTGLNVEDLDIPAKRARTRSKGGDVDWLFFRSGGARLPPRLIVGRRAGPVFLASLRPSPARAPAAGDICPLTGRARLSYPRAAEPLVAQTGWTLHQFRHSARGQSGCRAIFQTKHASSRAPATATVMRFLARAPPPAARGRTAARAARRAAGERRL